MKNIIKIMTVCLALSSCDNGELADLKKENASLNKRLDSLISLNTKEETKKKFYGEYVNQGKGIYKSFNFLGESSVVITDGFIGLPFATSYVRDGEILRIKTDKSDLLLSVIDSVSLKGEGFAEGVYKK